MTVRVFFSKFKVYGYMVTPTLSSNVVISEPHSLKISEKESLCFDFIF